jgi:nucleotide-binding universal stress UspA family protein
MVMAMNSSVVVGVDGSPSSLTAVEQAAEEAELRGFGLSVVHALTWPPVPISPGTPAYELGEEALLSRSEGILGDALARARSVAPGVEVTGEIIYGDPLTVLVEQSCSAPLVAVGSRGLGGFPGLLLGSVSVHLSAHARCPVLVARGTPDPSGPIVLGVDGSPGGRPATGFAFAEASLRKAELVAAHVWSEWTVPVSPPEEKSMPYAYEPGMLREGEERLLAEAVSGWCDTYPDVSVERRAVRGRTREELINASEDARLLVVGARGRGGFAGLLLGSVSQAALHHARSPVVVVPQKACFDPGGS